MTPPHFVHFLDSAHLKIQPKFSCAVWQAYHSRIILTLLLMKSPWSYLYELLLRQISAVVPDIDICHWKG